MVDVEKGLYDMARKSKDYMENISALELMENAGVFIKELEKLINRQRLPAPVIIGGLISAIHKLNTEFSDLLLDDKVMKSFKLFKRYVDENFIKKEK